MSKTIDVYGLGNGIMDLQIKVSDEDLNELGIAKASMNLVDENRQNEILQRFKDKDVHQASGGSAANTLIALAQLGAKTAYGCLLASDEFGTFYKNEMAELGIELYTTPVEDGKTGSSVILVTPDAERSMNTHLGASALLGPEHVSSRLIEASNWLYLEGYLFSTAPGREAIKRALKYATKFNTRVAITFSDTFIVEGFRDDLAAAVKYSELIFANQAEASAFCGETNEEKIFDSLSTVAPNVVMTVGEKGAKVSFSDEKFHVPAFKAEAVDDTGAGDMFAGGFLYGVTQGLKPKVATKFACLLASKVVSKLGPRLAGDIKSLEEVKAILSEQE